MFVRTFIGRFEGCHRIAEGLVWPYVCPAGYWTQGWGRLVSAGAPPQDRATIDLWFLEDILKHEHYALVYSPRLRDENEYRRAAITSFVYNLGAGRYKGSTLRKRVDVGDWTGAQYEIMKWVFGGGKVLPGLVLRRRAEAELLMREIPKEVVVDKEPDVLGTGMARNAAKKISGRQKQIDDAVDQAQGVEPEKKEEKSEPAKEKMSTHLLRRLAEMLRGKRE